MPFKAIHLLWLLANGPAKVHALPFHQNQRPETTSISTSSIDLANIVTPVTLPTSHTSPFTGTTNNPADTSKSQRRGTTTQTALLTVSPTLQTPSDVSSGSRSTASASTIMKPSSITPQPSPATPSITSTGPTTGAAVNVHTLTLNVPAIIMEHTVTTTVFVVQAPAEALTIRGTPSGVSHH